MKRDKQIILLGFPLLIVALLYLVSCATPELAAAESALQMLKLNVRLVNGLVQNVGSQMRCADVHVECLFGMRL
jgi:hypothetical protein